MLTDTIKKDFLDVLFHAVDFNTTHFSFDAYEKNKARFYNDFGNNLIVSKPIKIELSQENANKTFNSFLSYISFRKELHDFIQANGIEGFFQNKVLVDYEHDSKKIPSGMKLSKSFKFFVDDAWALNNVQVRYSQEINISGLEGNLCLSIHPLDYLSMSENDNGWRSCQSLDGEYASGTLSLMNDKVTLVAYLSNDKEYDIFKGAHLPKWNSKKWRMLVHIDNTVNRIVFSKHYPFNSPEIENELVSMIKSLYPDKQWQDKTLMTPEDKQDFVGNTKGRSNYNDITNSNTCHQLTTGEQSDKILIGSAVQCLHCGERHIVESQQFACEHCYEEYDNGCYCERCGDDGILPEDMHYVDNNNMYVCWHCFDSYYEMCDICDMVYDSDDIVDGHCADCNKTISMLEEASNRSEQGRQDIQGEPQASN